MSMTFPASRDTHLAIRVLTFVSVLAVRPELSDVAPRHVSPQVFGHALPRVKLDLAQISRQLVGHLYHLLVMMVRGRARLV